MADSIRPLVSIDPEDDESFRVMIDARTRHADLLPLVRQLGSTKALAEAIGIASQSKVGLWLNLKEYPSRIAPNHIAAVDHLHTLTGKTYDELWPPGLRRAIDQGRASRRADILVETSVLELAARQTERLMLPDPSDEVANEEVKKILCGEMDGVMNTLDKRSQEVLKMRFGLGEYDGRTFTYEEIGRVMKISKERVRQIELNAIYKLGGKFNRNNISKNHVLAAIADPNYQKPTKIITSAATPHPPSGP